MPPMPALIPAPLNFRSDGEVSGAFNEVGVLARLNDADNEDGGFLEEESLALVDKEDDGAVDVDDADAPPPPPPPAPLPPPAAPW